MEVGVVKIADDRDFDMLKTLVDNDVDWKLEYNKTDEATVMYRFYYAICDDDTHRCRFYLCDYVIIVILVNAVTPRNNGLLPYAALRGRVQV